MNHFSLTSDADRKANEDYKIACLYCSKQLTYCTSSTTLVNHLKRRHYAAYQQVVGEQREKKYDGERHSSLTSCRTDEPKDDKVSKDLKEAIVKWLVGSGRPTSIVEDPGLQTVLRIALQNKSYTLPSLRTIDSRTTRIFKEKVTELKNEIDGNCESLALTTDFWTAANSELYCDITGHWINSDWKLESVVLDCINVVDRRSAESLSDVNEDFISTWGIAEKTRCVVTDDAKNTIAAIGRMEFSHVPCVAHCIQLAILEGLKAADASPLVVKCQQLVQHFKRSSIGTSEQQADHSSVGNENSIFHKLQQDVPRRWSSTYIMLVRLLEVKDAIKQYHVDFAKNYNGTKLTEAEWEKMAKFVSVLSLLEEATQHLGREEYVPCSSVLPLILFLMKQLQISDDDQGYIARFKAATLHDLNKRVEGVGALAILQMATALDPRYKKLQFFNKFSQEAVWIVLQKKFEIFCNRKEHGLRSPRKEKKSSVVEFASDAKKPMLSLIPASSDRSRKEMISVGNGFTDLARYKAEDPIPETESPLMWWKLNDRRFPTLARFAKSLLSVPATSIPCQRLFTSSGYIINKAKASLLPENVTSQVCLRDWLK